MIVADFDIRRGAENDALFVSFITSIWFQWPDVPVS